MRSYIKIDSICTDLTNYNDKIDQGKCEHFTIRGYVSEFRKKDWKRCWPLPMNDEEQPSLPPLAVPKFRRWYCEKCRQETIAEVNRENDRTYITCTNGCSSYCNYSNVIASSSIQQALMLNGTPVNAEIDLNKPVGQSYGTNCLPTINEIENNAEVVQHNEITDHDTGSKNTLNHHISCVPLPEVDLGLINEVYTNKIGYDANAVSNAEVATEEGDLTNQTTKLLSLIDKVVKNDFQYHNVEKSTNLIHKGTQKMHSLSELLKENGDPKTNEAIIKRSLFHYPSNPSTVAAAKTPVIFPDKVDVQGDMALTNRGHGKKRKFHEDEESKPRNMCFQRVDNEVQNLKGGAKTINTIGKKHKKVHYVDNDLISNPPLGQQKGSESTVDVENTKASSKSHLSKFFPSASTEERMDGFPLHVLKKKNDDNSKGKRKMLQVDEEGATKQEIRLPFSLPFQEDTSRSQLTMKDNDTNFFGEQRISFNHISNVISANGKEVHLQEINGGGKKDRTTEVIELDNLERYWDLAVKDSKSDSLDDTPMEVVEFMARNQYERSLPDGDNVSGLIEKSTRMEKPQARGKRKNQKRGKHIT